MRSQSLSKLSAVLLNLFFLGALLCYGIALCVLLDDPSQDGVCQIRHPLSLCTMFISGLVVVFMTSLARFKYRASNGKTYFIETIQIQWAFCLVALLVLGDILGRLSKGSPSSLTPLYQIVPEHLRGMEESTVFLCGVQIVFVVLYWIRLSRSLNQWKLHHQPPATPSTGTPVVSPS
jgi:hypothetical protein